MAYIAANSVQITAVQVTAKPLAAPAAIVITPPVGDRTPQTHAYASLTG
jgi:hypothetical protein